MKIVIQIVLACFALGLTAQSTNSQEYAIGEKHVLYSKFLKESRELFIHFPKGFGDRDDNLKQYPITFVLDGESQFLTAVAAIDFLKSRPHGQDRMPKTIIVGIPNANRKRNVPASKSGLGKETTISELTSYNSTFLNFLTIEVEHYLDSLYSLNENRSIIGYSLSGLVVFEALLKKREFFNNYLAIDPYLLLDKERYVGNVLDTLRKANLVGENLFVAVASPLPEYMDNLIVNEERAELAQLTEGNLKFQKLVSAEEWAFNFSCVHFSKENHFSLPYSAIYSGMEFFAGNHQLDNAEIKRQVVLGEAPVKRKPERILFFLLFISLLAGGWLYLRRKRKEIQRGLEERNTLLKQVKSLQNKLTTTQAVSSKINNGSVALDKAKIEKAINAKLGESSWMILNIIYEQPAISNKEIAAQVSLSLEGVSSSLRRMYQAFDIKSSQSNKKVSLVMFAVRYSAQS